jgi:hypothetical protein
VQTVSVRKPSVTTLRRKLDLVFSAYIRKRDADKDGYGKCVTCRKWSLLEAGHFIPRQHISVRWDIRNVHGQCSRCNRWLHGDLIEYTLYMQKRYGVEVVEELMRFKNTTRKFNSAELLELIDKFSGS